MPKTARKKVESNIYHIVLRGINKQTIFFDDEDRKVFLNRIKLTKEKRQFEIYAFCLMSNHVHLLVKELDVAIGNIFMTMLSSYVLWYNRKYCRVGNLFQDRFRSEGIETDEHMFCAIRYIHQNPLKAKLVEHLEDYKWSSHSAYLIERESFVDTTFPLKLFGGVEQYKEFMLQDETMQFIEDANKITITDEDLRKKIEKLINEMQIYDLLKCNKRQISELIRKIRCSVKGASIRQISRVTGISVNIIRHIK